MDNVKKVGQSIIDFLLYSHLFIAFCAIAMTAQTFFLLDYDWQLAWPLLLLVFSATLVVYALHRLISLDKIKKSLHTQRYKTIRRYALHIKVYAAVAMLLGVFSFFYLQRVTQFLLILPALLSVGYVVPFLGGQKKRLRDINFIKIFLIAGVWAYVTVCLPFAELGLLHTSKLWYWGVERAIFIFIITLPFDIRDWEIDKAAGVQTLPATLGVQATLILVTILTIVWLILVFLLYPLSIFYGLLVSGLTTYLLVLRSPKQSNDYYFTAVMDGTMLIQFLLVLVSVLVLK
ncbi:MAG: UbiA family prenyltransferase [Aureispira sp.]|nr:UbiA family prenyltransferase [Aureispira sp.]